MRNCDLSRFSRWATHDKKENKIHMHHDWNETDQIYSISVSHLILLCWIWILFFPFNFAFFPVTHQNFKLTQEKEKCVQWNLDWAIQRNAPNLRFFFSSFRFILAVPKHQINFTQTVEFCNNKKTAMSINSWWNMCIYNSLRIYAEYERVRNVSVQH